MFGWAMLRPHLPGGMRVCKPEQARRVRALKLLVYGRPGGDTVVHRAWQFFGLS